MKIYKIQHLHSIYKFYLQDERDSLAIKAFSNDGSTLLDDWKPFHISLFEGKTKKEKSLSEDFNSSCYDDGLLYVSDSISFEVFKGLGEAEILPVLTSDGRDFKYINVINKIPSLKFNSKEELKEMFRSGKYFFDDKSVNGQLIFRDEVLTSTYFVTDAFVSKYGDKFKGISFEEVGEV